jgi:hypothetical protein
MIRLKRLEDPAGRLWAAVWWTGVFALLAQGLRVLLPSVWPLLITIPVLAAGAMIGFCSRTIPWIGARRSAAN